MERKLNQVGHNTLTVSLPSKWVRRSGLVKGDLVHVVEKDDDLLIRRTPRHDVLRSQLSLPEGDPLYVRQMLRNRYVAGFDEVEVFVSASEQMAFVHDALSFLPGFEVVEERGGRCLVRNLSAGLETELDTLLRKIFLLFHSLLEVAHDDFTNGTLSPQRAQDLVANIHRLSNLYRRVITKHPTYTLVKRRSIYIILTRVMLIASNMQAVYAYLASKPRPVSLDDALHYLEGFRALFSKYYDVFFAGSLTQISALGKERSSLVDRDVAEYLEHHHGECAVVIHYLAANAWLLTSLNGYILNFRSEPEE
jgi:hypothetical protein